MEFGSKFVYQYSDSSEEEVSEGEFEDEYAGCVPERYAQPAAAFAVDGSAKPEAECSKPQLQLPEPATSKGQKSIKEHHKSKRSMSEGPQKVHQWMKKQLPNFRALKSPGSDKSSASSERPNLVQQMPVPRSQAGKKWRRADTNVVAIKFDQLTAPSNMHTGDPVICVGCQVMLSHISKLTKDGENNVWICEFCGASNATDLVPEEIPTQSDVTYMIEPAPVTTASGRSGKDESLVVFCVDISGSMCVSQEVPGKMRLKGDHASRFSSLNTEGENQWLFGQSRNVTYVTRLQGLQAAVDNQIQELAKEHPDRRVGLVTFNNEVTIVGDGSGIPLTISGDKLSNEDELTRIGSEITLPGSIATSHETLGKKIFELEEGGQTALGPGLLVSTVIACQVPGSKVIICTDGLANVGLGNLDSLVTTEEFEAAADFYQKVSDLAKSKGVSVSILTIAGTECKLVELGRIASQTGGQVNAVDPMKLTQEFGNILSDPIIATRVVATFLVHKGLYIRNEVDRTSRSVKEVGNVSKGSEITFEYGVRHSSAKQTSSTGEAGASASAGAGETRDIPAEPQELPFQVQISYVDLEGARAVRVLTQTKPVTKERSQAEMYINMPAISNHAIKQSRNLASAGEYTPSRLNSYMYQRLMYRNVSDSTMLRQYDAYNRQQAPLANGLLNEQKREAQYSGRALTELDEDEDQMDTSEAGLEGVASSSGGRNRVASYFTRPSKAKAKRRMNCPDALAIGMYENTYDVPTDPSPRASKDPSPRAPKDPSPKGSSD